MRFILDISCARYHKGSKLGKIYRKADILFLPVVLGKHEKDFDLDEKRISKKKLKIIKEHATGWNNELPVGFDLKKLPVGAILKVISRKDTP